MSRQIQIRRGSAAENDAFTGAIGEITMDTTNKTLRVHDGTTTGGTTLAKQSEVSSGLAGKLNTSLDNLSTAAKRTIVSLCMPDYDHQTVGNITAPNTYITCQYDSFVVVWGHDPYTENYSVTIKTPNENIVCVGQRYDDTNSNTEINSFTFLCPKNHAFTCDAETGFEYRILTLMGAY